MPISKMKCFEKSYNKPFVLSDSQNDDLKKLILGFCPNDNNALAQHM